MQLSNNNLITKIEVIDNWVQREKIRGTKEILLTIPVRAYVYEIEVEKNKENDFIYNAIEELLKYYEKNGYDRSNEKLIEIIANDLCLSTSLVKLIIKNNKMTKNITLEENEVANERKKFVVFFDTIKQAYIPYILTDTEYEDMKLEFNEGHSFKRSLGSSNEYKFNCLSLPGKQPPYQPKVQDVRNLLYQRGRKYAKFLSNDPVLITSEDEQLGFACFYTVVDTIKYTASNPFHKGYARWLIDDVDNYLDYYKNSKNPVCSLFEDMKDAMNEKALNDTTDLKQDIRQQRIEELINDTYGKNEINRYPLLKNSLYIEIDEYYKMMAFNKLRGTDDFGDIDSLENYKSNDYYVALYTLIEKILRYSFVLNAKSENEEKYLKRIEDFDDSDVAEYRMIAKELMFDDTTISDKEKIRKNSIRWWAEHIYNNSEDDMDSLLCLNMIEALFDENHPFRRLSQKYNNAIGTIYKIKRLRNKSKHNNMPPDFFTFEFQYFVEELFEILVIPKQKNKESLVKKASLVMLDVDSLIKEQKAYKFSAVNALSKYKNLEHYEEIYNRVIEAEIDFKRMHTEYYTRVCNALDELFYLLLFTMSNGSNEINRDVLNYYLNGNYEKNVVIETVNNILETYKSKEKCTIIYSKELFKRYIGALTLGNKINYFIMLADKINCSFLRKFLEKNKKFISTIEKYEQLRGHGKQESFTKEEQNELNQYMLNFCDNVCCYINEFELEEF